MRILGIIPARGGSKGIPNKNSKLLAGKPLMQYTAEAALKSDLLDRVIFSSEDESLHELATSLGLEVPFTRPAHLSTDDAGSLEVVQHAIEFLSKQNEHYDAVCLLQLTNPFRGSEEIDSAIQKFVNLGTDSLISVVPVPHEYNPHWVFKESAKGLIELAISEGKIIKRRQELPKTYIRDGAIYLTKTNVLLEQHSFFGASISYVERDPAKHVNLDTMADWQKAEKIAKQWL